MTVADSALSLTVFLCTLVGTFVVAFLGRRHAEAAGGDDPGAQKLNKWLLGLSAGATANSGFVVTGAVGLGYAYGAQWIVLPLAWLLGDVVFWWLFPARINELGRESSARTLTDLVVYGLEGTPRGFLKVLSAVVVLVCLGGYVAAQWVAGQKFLEGAFGLEALVSLVAFAVVIVAYSAIGGFRGSIYADSFQAVIRLLGTTIAVGAVIYVAAAEPLFWSRLEEAGPSFMHPFPDGPLMGLGFVLGFAAAGLGFGLGQPQMVSRYLAGSSPEETRAAWWIYMFFVQFTWIAMTVFGMALRGVLPGLADPEAGLSVFFRTEMGPIFSGIIVADIFATISATSNSLLVTMAQTAKHDLAEYTGRLRGLTNSSPVLIAGLGVVTMVASLLLDESVFALALSSVSMMGAGLAPAVLVRLLRLPSTGASLSVAMVTGLVVAAAWKLGGLGGLLNEAAPGIAVGLVVNVVVARWTASRGAWSSPEAASRRTGEGR